VSEQLVALDTSVAVPLLVETHPMAMRVREALKGRVFALTEHSLAETYAVLTRLPGGAHGAPDDVARVLDSGFESPLLLPGEIKAEIHRIFARADISGGAIYDGFVALAAAHHDVPLLSRDGRAREVYSRLGATVVFIG
jgi:predicted nucleic acid-binding protein